MKAKPCVFEHWRNYVPHAPDLEYEVSNTFPTEIDLGRLLLQGSGTPDGHSPTPDVLDKVPAQRGWRCMMQIVSPPAMGNATMNESQDVITYHPRSGLLGTDCLNYVLNNGTQSSAQGRLFFKISKQYSWKFIITAMNSLRTEFNMKTVRDFDPQYPTPEYMEIFWFYTHPVVRKDPQGVKRVFIEREQVAATRANYRDFLEGEARKPTILESAEEVLIYTQFDTALGPAFEGWSGVPYSPKNTQGEIEVEFVVYNEMLKNPLTGIFQVDLSRPKKIRYLLSDLLGKTWWESGNIQQGY